MSVLVPVNRKRSLVQKDVEQFDKDRRIQEDRRKMFILPSVALSFLDRATQLDLSEDQLTVIGAVGSGYGYL